MCERVIPEGKAVLDHNHKTGYVRSVLCNCCNRCESITKTFRRYGMPEECLPVFLENLLEYWKQDFSENPLHPKHKSETEKLIKVNKKKLKDSKRPETKEKYQGLLRELKEKLKLENENCWRDE
ncbi:MAG: hypothetical protein Unbinned8472contig1000_18 [Prokaryotic dsDNA virus sp.]|nr:MAG: hypothetical protein Unbinned8472contig1000_18 [Prokaryotic dsDNA virus sp.]